jgi:hypothetical protein
MSDENDGNRATKNRDGGGSENHCSDNWQRSQLKTGLDADIGRGCVIGSLTILLYRLGEWFQPSHVIYCLLV